MQGLGSEGPQLAGQGEASSGAILGELWGSCRKLLKRHELGNLQRTKQEKLREEKRTGEIKDRKAEVRGRLGVQSRDLRGQEGYN